MQRLAEGMGITFKRHGADLLGLCLFHDDKEPSLVITPKQNLWHCLGACQCGGSVIDWVMQAEGVSFRHAVELLQADYGPSALAAGSGPSAKDHAGGRGTIIWGMSRWRSVVRVSYIAIKMTTWARRKNSRTAPGRWYGRRATGRLGRRLLGRGM